MIDRSHALPVARQARELGISRASVYYLPKPVSAADLAIMRRMDELHLSSPLPGAGCCTIFCGRRPHSSLAAKTPDQAYFDNLPIMVAA